MNTKILTRTITAWLFCIASLSVFGQQAETNFSGKTISTNAYNQEIPIKFIVYAGNGKRIRYGNDVHDSGNYPVAIIIRADETSKEFVVEFINYDTERDFRFVYYNNVSKEGPFKRSFATVVKKAKSEKKPRTKIEKFPMNKAVGNVSNVIADGIDPREWYRNGTAFQITMHSMETNDGKTKPYYMNWTDIESYQEYNSVIANSLINSTKSSLDEKRISYKTYKHVLQSYLNKNSISQEDYENALKYKPSEK